MKKALIILSALIITCLSLYTTAFAKVNSVPQSQHRWRTTVLQFQERRQEIRNTRLSRQEQIIEIRKNKNDNIELWRDNKELRQDTKADIISIKNGEIIPDETLREKYTELAKELSVKYKALQDTKGQIATLLLELRNTKKSDSDAINSIYFEIIEIQLDRNILLIEINGILSEIVALS